MDTEVIDALARLENRYESQLAHMKRCENDDALPRWMRGSDRVALRATLTAQRNLARDLRKELQRAQKALP